MKTKTTYTTLSLPVFKQGDDLSSHLNEAGDNVSEALLKLAAQYAAASDMCSRVADALKLTKQVTVDAMTHHIGVYGPQDQLQSLIDLGDLIVNDPDEDVDMLIDVPE